MECGSKKSHAWALKEITNYIKIYIETYKIINTATEQKVFPTKLLGINKTIEYNNSNKNINLDIKDFKILSLVSTNSRMEYIKISKKLKLTPNAIKYKLKKLEKAGIIKGYTISIDIRKLGYEWYNLQLKLINSEKEMKLTQFLKQNKSVIYYYKYLKHKAWDLNVGIIVKNSLELRGFLLELKEHFSDTLKFCDSYIIIEELKGNYAPKGVFEL